MEEQVVCAWTGKKVNRSSCSQGFTIRPSITRLIKDKVPSFDKDSWIQKIELRELKKAYTRSLTDEDKGQIADLQKKVADAVAKHEFLSTDYFDSATVKEKAPFFVDHIASFLSSWKFGATFLAFIAWWVYINRQGGFDTYPFNLLDLVLGALASMQALFIMISQKREAEQDRLRALNDFKVGLKNEFELTIIREKIDHIINIQNPHLREVLEMMMEDKE